MQSWILIQRTKAAVANLADNNRKEKQTQQKWQAQQVEVKIANNRRQDSESEQQSYRQKNWAVNAVHEEKLDKQ